MTSPERDTIYALSSARGRAGVAVIRISGSQAVEILRKITKKEVPPVRRLSVRRLFAGADVIDEAMVVWFEAGASFTSEEMVELHTHGGRATVISVLNLLAELPDIRSAGPGEFTRRALEAGRMDLIEVEALADLINAETEEQRKQALSLMIGDGQAQARKWRSIFLRSLALLEASIDFADEEDAPEDVSEEVSRLLIGLERELRDAISGARRAARVRDGFRIALVGAPNSGKSTLLNALAKRQAAITSPIAGTTRDVIEISCDFDGYPVVLYDMAGLRDTDDPVEKIGVARAYETARDADLRIFLSCPDADEIDALELHKAGDISVRSKSDMYPTDSGFSVSSVTGEGIEELVRHIVRSLVEVDAASPVFARERQIDCLRVSLQSVRDCLMRDEPELMVEHLRHGVTLMNHLFGVIQNEEILGEIFSQFCIGK